MYSEKTSAIFLKYRRMTCLLLAVLTLTVILLNSVNRISAQAAIRPLTIPDPTKHFGKVHNIDIGEKETMYSFRVVDDRSPGPVARYCSALEGAGLTTDSEPDDSLIIFKYRADPAVKISSSVRTGEILVRVDNALQMEKSTPKLSVKALTIPSPADYFGDFAAEKKGYHTSVRYWKNISTYPEDSVTSYVEALMKLGLTEDGVRSETGGDFVVTMKYRQMDSLWIRWEASTGSLVITTISCLTFEDSGEDSVGENAFLDIMESYFGEPYRISFDAEQATITFLYKNLTGPESAIRAYVNEMKNIGATCYLHSFPADGGCQIFIIHWDDAEVWIGGKWSQSDNTLSISINGDWSDETNSADAENHSESGVPSA